MVIKLRSKRLAQLFTEVWEHLPEKDRALLAQKTRLVLDNPNFLPITHSHQTALWGAALGIGVKKSIAIVYLSPRKLPHQSDKFVRYVIAQKLGHIFCGHIEQLFLSPHTDSPLEGCQERFVWEADRQASLWGFPIVSPRQTRKPSRKRVG